MLTPIPFSAGDRVEYYDGRPAYYSVGTVNAVGIGEHGRLICDVTWDDHVEDGEYDVANLRKAEFRIGQDVSVMHIDDRMHGKVTSVSPRIVVLWSNGDIGTYSRAQLCELLAT